MRLAQRAEKRTLICWVTFDLVGLLPDPSDVSRLATDASPDEFHRVVDRLLASPRYGERWGRHWFDVARDADTKGCVDESIMARTPMKRFGEPDELIDAQLNLPLVYKGKTYILAKTGDSREIIPSKSSQKCA